MDRMVASFPERWRDKERAYGLSSIAAAMVACGSAVLPDSAAPCLCFKNASRPVPIWETFTPSRGWSPADRERLGAYRVIGSDGAGSPICVEQGSGVVVLLDHEDRFHSRQFINSSVRQLAECLLACMGEHESLRLRSAIQDIDPAALVEGSFWWHEVTDQAPTDKDYGT